MEKRASGRKAKGAAGSALGPHVRGSDPLDVLTFGLGLALWGAVVLLPALLSGAALSSWPILAACGLPALVLAVAWFARSAVALLLVFPASLGGALTVLGPAGARTLLGAVPAAAALALALAFGLRALRSTGHMVEPPKAEWRVGALSRAFFSAAVLALLVWRACLDSDYALQLEQSFGERAAMVRAALLALGLAVWAAWSVGSAAQAARWEHLPASRVRRDLRLEWAVEGDSRRARRRALGWVALAMVSLGAWWLRGAW